MAAAEGEGPGAMSTAAEKPKLVAVAGIDFVHGYAGTQYLLERLGRWFDVSIYVLTPHRNRAWYKGLSQTCHVFPTRGYAGRIRPMSKLFRAAVFLRMLGSRHVLITEATYLREAAWAKRLRGGKMALGQFCQELFLPEEYPAGSPKGRWSETQRHHALAPDVVVDVEPHRARVRQEYYGLARLPYVLPNTFPLGQMPERASAGALWELAGILRPPEGMPVLVHAGGIGAEKPLERIIDAVSGSGVPVFLLAFCTAKEEDVRRVREYAAKKLPADRFRICPPVSREDLRARLWEADVGVVDYSHSSEPTTNQKHCAPTKLYEYMACGLAVLGSNNDSLREVVERERIGMCAAGDGTRDLAVALRAVLQGDLAGMKIRARAAFEDRHCYEMACDAAVEEIAGEMLRRGAGKKGY